MGEVAHSPVWVRKLCKWIDRRVDMKMAGTTVAEKALCLLNAFERAGKSVSRISVDGRKIEIQLGRPEEADEFDKIEMRHDKA